MAAPASHQHDAQEVAGLSSPQGKLTALARGLKLLATAIRKGYAPLGLLIAKLDPKSVGPFLKHSAKISDLLDDFAKIPDVTSKIVNDRLFHLLSDKNGAFKIAPGLAKDIAEGTVIFFFGLRGNGNSTRPVKIFQESYQQSFINLVRPHAKKYSPSSKLPRGLRRMPKSWRCSR